MYYATRDNDGYSISENATIVAFDTLEEAERYARQPEEANLEEGERLEVTDGEYGDCWFKTDLEPTPERLEVWAKPFNPDDLIVQNPGTHPGGKVWWIKPRPPVLVAVLHVD